MLIDGRARPTGVRQRGTEAAMLVVVNGHHDLVEFTLPTFEGGTEWMLELDTNIPESPHEYRGKAQDKYGMTGRSMMLLVGVTVRKSD